MKQVINFHATLSPSAASRWLNCAGSVLAGTTTDRKTSSYAEEGTAAHKLLELCLRLECHPEELHGVRIHESVQTGGAVEIPDYHVDDDMVEAVAHAYDYIRAFDAKYRSNRTGHSSAKVLIERQVHWGAQGHIKLSKEVASGTADVILVAPGRLVVMDYKHGAGKVVEVEDNEQAKLYAIGALNDLDLWDKVDEVLLVIVQPRARHEAGPIREWAISVDDLDEWAQKVVAPRAKAALKPNAKRTAGHWCRWCAAAPTCRALVDKVMEDAGTEFSVLENNGLAMAPPNPHDLTMEELARAQAAADLIEAWVHAVRGRVLELLLSGRELPGWKLVQGRSTRAWDEDQMDEAARAAHEHLGDPRLYAPRVLLSPAQLEDAFKLHARQPKELVKDARARFKATFAPYIARSTPAIHVAPEHDPRPAYTPGTEFDPLL